jgi:hypothetical protein
MHGAKGPEVMAMLDRMLSEAAGDSSRVILVPEMRETAPAQPSTGSLMESSIDTTLGGGTEFLPTSAGDGP